MCVVCGCDVSVETLAGAPHHHGHAPDHEHGPGHDHDHGHHHHHHPQITAEHLDFGRNAAGMHIPGISPARTLRIERDVLSRNAGYARENRARLAGLGMLALNLVSSPGSGKTSLLVRTIAMMKDRFPITVIEGDQQTSNDAERIRATGVPAIQVNTGKGCHLDAHMVGQAMSSLNLSKGGLLFIENVGNLVCPAAFDLGEAHKVVVLSVTEGEDKPLKYPDMFAASDLMLLNKTDLLPHVDFDAGACFAAALRVNPRIQILPVSARTGEGLSAFHAWIEARAGLAAHAGV